MTKPPIKAPVDHLTVEAMTTTDLECILAIERGSFPHPWTKDGFMTELNRRPARCLVLLYDRAVCGYLIFWWLPPEMHLLNIAVHPSHRQQGLGRFLIKYMLDYGRETGIHEVFLEVRPSNTAARRLYESLGFSAIGIRKNYYSEEHEDAIVMTCRLIAHPEDV
ncbi:MAG: ribosomal protein S18-alanine N-acetyltransferase [Deltaproteobacteria bacterium]|nr:ribosomal protein S18-alanine N-acetyltransferase [Deltaproteobacteria bacterium]